MAGRDIADSAASFISGTSDSKDFVVLSGQTVGPFKVSARTITIQVSSRKNYVSGPVPAVANLVIEGSLDGITYYPLANAPAFTGLGLHTFDCMVPLIRFRGDFSGAMGTIYIYGQR